MKTSKLKEKSVNGGKTEAKRKKENSTGFEQWGGYMNAKKEKLSAQYKAQKPQNVSSEISQIFKGISIFVNGYTRPPAEELKNIMLDHGGTYHFYYSTTHTTHIIATNLANSKIKNLKDEKVVTPEWITDSIKASRLLPYCDYLLYTPERKDRQCRLDSKLVNTTRSSSTVDSPPFAALPEAYIPNAIDENGIYTNSKQEFDFNGKQNSEKINALPFHSCIETGSSETDSVSLISSKIMDVVKSPDGSRIADSPTKAGDPNFLSEFYSHSRLHHISTSGQELKQYVQQLVQTQRGKVFPGRKKLQIMKNNGFVKYSIPSSQDRMSIENYDSDPSDQWLAAPISSIMNLNTIPHKIIMHIDMDCFFVSVGLKKHPELRGHPVVVTHSKGKKGTPQPGSDIQYEANYYNQIVQQKVYGPDADFENEESDFRKPINSKYLHDFGSLSEIACCSYEARKAGLHNGMFLGEALKLCPNLKTIPYDFDGYSVVSKQLYDIVARYSLDIEAVSCDELYIDCSDLLQDTEVSPMHFASVLREEIAEVTGCTASAGLGINMLLARLATRVAKPNGQYFLLENKIEDFIKKQKVEDLPGIGYSTSAKLERFGIFTCKDLQAWPLEKLQKEFGPKSGKSLYEHCRGRDDREVTLEKERKSVSAEINYGIRFQQEKDVFNFLDELAFEVHQRLKKIQKKGKSLTLKLKIRKDGAPKATAKFMGHGVCDSISKSVILKSSTDDPVIISDQCRQIAQDMKLNPEDYRGVGIQMTKLESLGQRPVSKTLEYFLRDTTNNSNNNPAESAVSELKNVGTDIERKDVFPCKKNPLKTVKDFFPSVSGVSSAISTKPPDTANELDESFLSALPEDIRNEVLLMYGKKKKSPMKKIASPQKQNKNCTAKRGRKKRNLKTSPKKPLKINNIKLFTSGTTTSGSSSMAKEFLMNKTEHSLDNVRNSSSIIKELPVNQMEKCRKADLCGSIKLDSVRDLVKEWVQSSEVPREDDTEQFKDYLLAVIDEKDLEKVDLLLKHFFRLAQGTNILWQDTYLTVLSYIQQKMLQEYGYMLKANCEF